MAVAAETGLGVEVYIASGVLMAPCGRASPSRPVRRVRPSALATACAILSSGDIVERAFLGWAEDRGVEPNPFVRRGEGVREFCCLLALIDWPPLATVCRDRSSIPTSPAGVDLISKGAGCGVMYGLFALSTLPIAGW